MTVPMLNLRTTQAQQPPLQVRSPLYPQWSQKSYAYLKDNYLYLEVSGIDPESREPVVYPAEQLPGPVPRSEQLPVNLLAPPASIPFTEPFPRGTPDPYDPDNQPDPPETPPGPDGPDWPEPDPPDDPVPPDPDNPDPDQPDPFPPEIPMTGLQPELSSSSSSGSSSGSQSIGPPPPSPPTIESPFDQGFDDFQFGAVGTGNGFSTGFSTGLD